MAANEQNPEPLSNDYYFLLQSLIYDSDNDISKLEDQIISLVEKGSQNTIRYIEFILSKASRVQFWKIPSLYYLSLSLESRLNLKLKLDHLLFKFIQYKESNPNGSFPDFCVLQTDNQWKDLILILSTDDSDKLKESHFQRKDPIKFDMREHKLIDLLWKFHSKKCIEKFKVDPTKVDIKYGFKVQGRESFEGDKPVGHLLFYSRQSWFFDIFGSAISNYYIGRYNYANLILPTKIAQKFILYGPKLVRKEVRKNLFGEETAENYNKLIHYADLIWKKDEFEFEENMAEPFIIILLTEIISSYSRNHPKEYEYVLTILKKISNQITDKIFHSLTDKARQLKPMLVKIGCDYRTQAEKDFVFFPFDDEYQVHDLDFFDYFRKNYPGFTKEDFSKNREQIYDLRFCFGYGYTFYEDDVDEFIKIYSSDSKNDTAYDMFYEEIGLIDVAAWFGAEKIYNYLKNNFHKKLSSHHLAFFGGNSNIINDCFDTEMSDYEKTRLVFQLLYDRQFDLAIKICDKNEVNKLEIYNYMFAPLDVIKRIKGAKVSGSYYADDDKYLISYWYTFIEDNKLDVEIPSFKPKLVKMTPYDQKKKPTKLIL